MGCLETPIKLAIANPPNTAVYATDSIMENVSSKILVVIPTYNEASNVHILIERLLAAPISFEVLFVDDNSPDGTGQALDGVAAQNPRIHVLHRSGKLGIGSAHRDGICWGYDRGYDFVATMDADLTHDVNDLVRILEDPSDASVIVTSRFMRSDSLEGWNAYRKALTKVGHLLTKITLNVPYDATGGLRRYDTRKLPKAIFQHATSSGYAYLFEVMTLIVHNKYSVHEVEVRLPPRTYGNSKMSVRQIFNSVYRLGSIKALLLLAPERLQVAQSLPEGVLDKNIPATTDWETYWALNLDRGQLIYDLLATIYRRCLISPAFKHFMRKQFNPRAKVLHAGCGGGGVDIHIVNEFQVTAVDISPNALRCYHSLIGDRATMKQASILSLPFADNEFDGAYNLGVMEHFSPSEIEAILAEMFRVIRPGGHVLVFWPPKFGFSVRLFNSIRAIARFFGRKEELQIHPPEPSQLSSLEEARSLFEKAGFRSVDTYFGPRDFFTQVAIRGEKQSNPVPSC